MQNTKLISLAQWALIDEFRSGQLHTLELPRVTRKDFGLCGIELVNTLFESTTLTYLDQLKEQGQEQEVDFLLIMVDDEGDGCSGSAQQRKQFAIAHRKWIDIADYLGCKAIRTNCRGNLECSREESLRWATESYQLLLEYAAPVDMQILIENHGGLSNDADWLVALMKQINHPLMGTYPDWREPGPDFDPFHYLKTVLPFAKGMSYRNQPTENLTAQMIELCKMSRYTGWYGIESNGRAAIQQGIAWLTKYL